MLVFTDGACLNNGRPNSKAGWAFVVDHPNIVIKDRLELRGPYGDLGVQSSNRAELRAVIAALQYRAWGEEGFRTLVIATDSEYVVKGATAWIYTWLENGWRTANSEAVKNKDMWTKLMKATLHLRDQGTSTHFWRIPRDLNTVADAGAKAAAEAYDIAEWTKRRVLSFGPRSSA